MNVLEIAKKQKVKPGVIHIIATPEGVVEKYFDNIIRIVPTCVLEGEDLERSKLFHDMAAGNPEGYAKRIVKDACRNGKVRKGKLRGTLVGEADPFRFTMGNEYTVLYVESTPVWVLNVDKIYALIWAMEEKEK